MVIVIVLLAAIVTVMFVVIGKNSERNDDVGVRFRVLLLEHLILAAFDVM